MLIGNGLGCWKTIETRRRRSVTSIVSTSVPSRKMRPMRVAVGVSSVSRLSERRSVVLPQPDGPMRPSTSPRLTGIETPLTASFPP